MTLYVASCAPTAISVSTDCEIVAPAAGLVKIWRLQLWQTSDLGDANEEVIDIRWIIGFTVSGSGGPTTNTEEIDSRNIAPTATVELLNTTLATTGTTRDAWRDGWNIRIPYNFVWLPEERPIISNSERGVFRLAAPADAITAAAAITFEQL
jgi:hypothetical protein